jgi:hypothetical protein
MGFLTSPANQSKLKVARINSRRFIYEISLEKVEFLPKKIYLNCVFILFLVRHLK